MPEDQPSSELEWSDAEWGDVEPEVEDDFVPMFAEGDEPVRRRSAGPVVIQFLLALVAIAVFVGIYLAWRRDADSTTALAAMVGVLVVILLLEILFFGPVYHTLFGRRAPRAVPMNLDDENFIVGCPGCGTVFTVDEDEVAAGSFQCHHCGRAGYVRDHDLNASQIREEVCATCGNLYHEWMEHSECPICHTMNSY